MIRKIIRHTYVGLNKIPEIQKSVSKFKLLHGDVSQLAKSMDNGFIVYDRVPRVIELRLRLLDLLCDGLSVGPGEDAVAVGHV